MSPWLDSVRLVALARAEQARCITSDRTGYGLSRGVVSGLACHHGALRRGAGCHEGTEWSVATDCRFRPLWVV